VPASDAFQARKLREAGALVLANANMAEFAWSPFETVGSLLPGYTRNPYALDRVPAGSSGGKRGGDRGRLQILGQPWSQPTLIRIGRAYEQATRRQRSPASTPPLSGAP
jgi:Asp-tRNA(Asn)/Glu-tRNA(Gln) amidotransferase A subunit family amidase